MRNFQDTFETPKRPFISGFSICMTVLLIINYGSSITGYRTTKDLRPEEISKYSLVPSLTAKMTIYS